MSTTNAEMNVTAAMTDTKPASATVDHTTLILPATQTTEKNAASTSGANQHTNVLPTNSPVALKMVQSTLVMSTPLMMTHFAAQPTAPIIHMELKESTMLSDVAHSNHSMLLTATAAEPHKVTRNQ